MPHIFNPWEHNGEILYNNFKWEGSCTSQHIRQAIKNVLDENPNCNLYFGITHNPCGRWLGRSNQPLPPKFVLNEGIAMPPFLLTERAHNLDYEKMYVICFCEKEEIIRDTEAEAILLGKELSMLRISNDTKGRNGNLPKDAPFYFLYICVV